MQILTALRTQIKWILALFIVIFTASVGFMYGTGGSSDSDNQRTGDFVVAKVNGEELRISQLQEHLRSFVDRNGIRDLSDKQMPLIYKAVFDEMVSNRAVIDEVARLKISAPADDVDRQLKEVENQYVTKEAFMQTLKNQGSSLEQVKAEIARQLAINKMLEDVSGGVVVSDDEIKALYDALRGNFTLPAGIEADFVQLKSKEAADKFAEEVKADKDWDKALTIVSADVVQATSNDVHERIAAMEMVGKLEPISALNDGEISAPIEITSQDYFVVHRIKAVSEDVRPLSEVSDGIKTMLLQSKKVEAQRNYIKGLTDKMNVEIVAPELFTVTSDDVPPGDALPDEKLDGLKPAFIEDAADKAAAPAAAK